MALDYAKSFYNSKKWKDLRLYVCQSRHYTCEECGDYGDQVHHVIEITPDNINDPSKTTFNYFVKNVIMQNVKLKRI